jgi:hypothetical protein
MGDRMMDELYSGQEARGGGRWRGGEGSSWRGVVGVREDGGGEYAGNVRGGGGGVQGGVS